MCWYAGIAVYDWLLTFSREVDVIWRKQRKLVPTILFVWQRYISILQGVWRFLQPVPAYMAVSSFLFVLRYAAYGVLL